MESPFTSFGEYAVVLKDLDLSRLRRGRQILPVRFFLK